MNKPLRPVHIATCSQKNNRGKKENNEEEEEGPLLPLHRSREFVYQFPDPNPN